MKIYKKYQLSEIVNQLLEGNKALLASCITLIESDLKEDRSFVHILFKNLPKTTKNSIRIGITGVPGAGKSTFINTFGNFILKNEPKRKLAVLTIDPSSSYSQGSILGDKTRMESLVLNDRAYIRPSASRGILGGVNAHTYETILFCEKVGFDTIFVETVGVGQSESMVKDLTDLLLFLAIPQTGDDLQGIKKGIMEMVDIILINKSDVIDGPLLQKTTQDFKNALHCTSSKRNYWTVPIIKTSGLKQLKYQNILEHIDAYVFKTKQAGDFNYQRHQQLEKVFHQQLQHYLIKDFYNKNECNIHNQIQSLSLSDENIFDKIKELLDN